MKNDSIHVAVLIFTIPFFVISRNLARNSSLRSQRSGNALKTENSACSGDTEVSRLMPGARNHSITRIALPTINPSVEIIASNKMDK